MLAAPSQPWPQSLINVPATQAVRKQAAEPATNALTATLEMSPFLWTAMKLRALTWMPTDAGLENPHRA